MKNTNTLWKVSVVLGLFLMLTMAPGAISAAARTTTSMNDTVVFSSPTLKDNDQFINVAVREASDVTTVEGNPTLPVYTKTIELPWGTKVVSVDVQPTLIQTMSTVKQVSPVPTKQKIGTDIIPIGGILDQAVYASADPSPSTWYTYTTGAGLNAQNEHVIFLSIQITPVRYLPARHLLQYSTSFSVHAEYTLPVSTPKSSTTYQLVIIAPAEYATALQPLVDHKNNYSMPTILVTLDQIYGSYPGRDNPEMIKYFIKHAIEDWNTEYVLLVGDMKKVPIRQTFGTQWEDALLSDQYYADVYNADGDFCSWDRNGNNRFGETTHQGGDLDGVDLYADVNVGRLACVEITEVTTIVNKIITYEQQAASQTWFKRIVLAGGDTFPLAKGAPPFVYEGEITNTKVAQTIPDFIQNCITGSVYYPPADIFNL